MSRYSRRPLFRLLGLTVELDRLHSESAQQEAWRHARRRSGRAEQFRAILPALLFPPLLWFFVRPLLGTMPVSGAIRAYLIPIASFVLIIALVNLAVWLVRRTYRRRLREHLCQVGLPTCIPCGYDLTGNTSGRCPECGQPAEQAV
jgi:Flp pilus assembly protein TadB